MSLARPAGYRRVCLAAFAAVLIQAAVPQSSSAQTVAGSVAGNVAGTVSGGATAGNVAGATAGGIIIDSEGVMRTVFLGDPSDAIARKRMEAFAGKNSPPEMNKASLQRKVSLVRLEQALEPFADQKKDVPPAMNFLAGLQRIDYVFVYPDEKDIVIAGPAEGFAPDAAGRVIGLTSKRPPLRLDDLMVALRSQERGGAVGCSIDPVPERLAAFERYVRANSTAASPDQIGQRYREMARVLGNQDVRIWGVPPETHFAQILVEADYRMKLLSVGLEQPNVKGFKSHLSMAPARGKSMQRWWFAPLYDPFRVTEDGNGYEFRGQRAQLMAQDEVTDGKGNKADAATTRVSSAKWAQHFTEKFPELAEKVPIFGELQNLFDLEVLSALLRKDRLPEKVGWKMSLFLDAERATVATGRAPRQVPSVSNYKINGQRMITGLVGGGVVLNPQEIVRNGQYEKDSTPGLSDRKSSAARQKDAAGNPWWWD